MNEYDPETAAHLRLVMRRRFLSHLVIFAAVMAALVVGWVLLWAAAGIGFPWFLVLALGWAVALGIEAAEAFGPGEVTAREVRAEVSAERRQAAERARRLRNTERTTPAPHRADHPVAEQLDPAEPPRTH